MAVAWDQELVKLWESLAKCQLGQRFSLTIGEKLAGLHATRIFTERDRKFL